MNNNVPFIKVNGIEYIKRPKFFSIVSESKCFKTLMLFLLFSEVITTILKSNYKAQNHRTSNIFKELHIFFTTSFLIEFIFNFFAKPKKYFKKLRNTCDFIALILSLISIYYENFGNHRIDYGKSQYYQKDFNYTNIQIKDDKNDTTQNETYIRKFYSWDRYRRQRAQMEKSPIHKSFNFLREKISLLFSILCTPRNSPFNLLDVFQSIRLVRVFYLDKYLKTEFKSLVQVTSSSFPIILIFSVFIAFFGFIGNYLYGKGTPTLFGNIFISMFTVFGVSTKDMWTTNTKLINKGIIRMKELNDLNQSKEHEFEIFNKQNWKKYKNFVPKQINYEVSEQNYDDINPIQSDFDFENYYNQELETDPEQEKKIDEETAQISIDNKEKVAIDVDDQQLTYEGLKQLQQTNTRLFKSKTIIHNSFEYTLKKKIKNSTYSVWFTVSIVTVLGTILSTFIVSGVTDTFTSGTENYLKKEKRKAIRKVVKLLKKYKDQFIQNSETENANKSSDPEVFLSNKQFNNIINILEYLKKSEDSLKDFIKENNIKIVGYKEPIYHYNFTTEYYNADYFEFKEEDDFKKEVLKRRRLIEELELMLQFYLEQAQKAFVTEVKNKHKNSFYHLRDITRRNMKKHKERRIKSLNRIPIENSEIYTKIEAGCNNLTLQTFDLDNSSEQLINKSTRNNKSTKASSSANENSNNDSNIDIEIINNDNENNNNIINNNDENENSNNHNHNDDNENSNNHNHNDDNENSNNHNHNDDNENSNNFNNENNNNNDVNENNDNNNDVSTFNNNENDNNYKINKFKLAAFNAGSLHKVDIDVNSNASNEIAINESGNVSNSKNSEAENPVKIDINSDGFEDISVEDYSDAYDSSETDEISKQITLDEFECFGAAANVGLKDVERFPPSPTAKNTVIFNPQFIKAMKIILKNLINDMEDCIELQSAFIARLSELSNGS